ncbi:uncharacterized protein BDCG_07680 [Blastomyces dermatitidis ER-3]|uniref:Uncharacterized protein n=1 Tax=Ajellomyces dermatitidis (strain ER-3 / ATCC MYA-2586) TaxID=559297 RepID=A0ABP2F7R9_AJEDR|nr:uncharacterized protein BDCG_07680 [Blastomyces dermatitidis ER-3]EEQ92560.2 hypothetical protein BDCG_07680 [Blastomyces dermatitidis ER-3]
MKREREKKSVTVNKQQQKKIEKQELAEKERIEALFRSQMHFMIQDIKETALLSEHVNLLITGMEPKAADQKMRDFEAQVDLAEREQQKPFSEKTVKRDFEMIIISDEEKEKKKKKKKKKNEK